MSVLLAVTSTLKLVAPLLAGSAVSLALIVLGRRIAMRNYIRAASAIGAAFEIAAPAASASILNERPSDGRRRGRVFHEASSSSTFAFRPAKAPSRQLPIVCFDPTQLEPTELTRCIPRARINAISPADSASMTLRVERVYLDADDLIEA